MLYKVIPKVNSIFSDVTKRKDLLLLKENKIEEADK